jgi:hypothetical protein
MWLLSPSQAFNPADCQHYHPKGYISAPFMQGFTPPQYHIEGPEALDKIKDELNAYVRKAYGTPLEGLDDLVPGSSRVLPGIPVSQESTDAVMRPNGQARQHRDCCQEGHSQEAEPGPARKEHEKHDRREENPVPKSGCRKTRRKRIPWRAFTRISFMPSVRSPVPFPQQGPRATSTRA